MLNIEIIGVLLSVLMYIIYNTLVKRLASATGNYKAAMVIMVLSLVPMIAIAYVLQASWLIGLVPLLISVIAGIFTFVGFELYYRALHTEQLTNSAGLNSVGNALIVVFGIFVLHERIAQLGLIGIVMIFVGSFLIATKRGFDFNRKLLPAVLASISFSIVWVLLSYVITSTNNFIVPLLISRAVGVIIAIPYIHAFKRKSHLVKHKRIFEVGIPLLIIGVLAGIADGAGDTLFGFITLHKYLAIGGALTILTTVGVSVLAYFVYKDRLTKLELIGLLVAILGAAILIFG